MKKILSSILMITGTTIGGGMVILPAVIGVYSYYSAIAILMGVWLFNTLLALIFLECTCYLPRNSNLISMSQHLLGKYAAWAAWIVCLVFLYTIMCAYTMGITEILSGFLEKNLIHISSSYLSILAIAVISLPIYFGVSQIYLVNRCIVIAMFAAFFALIFLITPHIELKFLLETPSHLPTMALPLVFTSFGFLIIIPSLRDYLDDNIRHIKIAIIVGSFIPLICYIVWVTLVMGTIPTTGDTSLHTILAHSQPVSALTNILISQTGNAQISLFIQIFILFAIASSFIGIALGLFDFLADGLNISKKPTDKIKLLALTFMPPLIIVLTLKNLFITALGFAGLTSIIIFGIYPVMLAWSGRYIYKLKTHYRVSANRLVLALIIVASLAIIGIELYSL